jgi:cation transport regulator
MAYQQLTDLPQDVQEMPQDAQQMFMAAYNSIEESGGDQSQAQQVAWDTVTRTYAKDEGGQWHRMPDESGSHAPVQQGGN